MAQIYDTLIIGSGPAGLTASIYAQRARLQALTVERDYEGSGQIADSERVDNYPGLYGESGYALGEKFRQHAQALGAPFCTGEVTAIQPAPDGYAVTLADGTVLHTRTVLYAAGARPRQLHITGEDALRGHGVSYCAVCDAAFYRNRTVAVVGGGDTALQDALLLSKVAAQVILIHRRPTLRGNRALQETLRQAANVQWMLDAVPLAIHGERTVQALTVRQGERERMLSLDGVFVAVGTEPNSALLREFGVLDDAGYVQAGEDGVTAVAGLFAAGDVRQKPLRQVVTAAADGACCVQSIERYLEQRFSGGAR